MDYDGYVCLADFGLAKFLPKDTGRAKSFCGTPYYLPPEMIDGKEYGFSVDWWTLGIVLYEMATGTPPFVNRNNYELGKLIRDSQIFFPDPNVHGIFMSQNLIDIILRVSTFV